MSMARLSVIYALKDPRTREIRYIGQTINLAARISSHLSEARQRPLQTHRSRWLRSVLDLGLRPLVETLEITPNPNPAEQRWIALARRAGAKLVNATDGGDGSPGHTASYATRQKLAARIVTPEHRARMSAAAKQRAMTLEGQQNARRAGTRNRGTPKSLDAIRRSAQARRGRKQSAEARARISEAAKKRDHTAAVAAMAAANRGRTRTFPLQWRSNMSAARKGKPWTAARRAAQTNRRTG